MDRIDYAVRPNKNVERKLVFDGIRELLNDQDLDSYRYIGMGGLRFVDFLLAHKQLGIASMLSIESKVPSRAEFNCPLACIEVMAGETTMVLGQIQLEQSPAIIWLDHDSDISGSVLEDIGLLGGLCHQETVALVTINADNRFARSCEAGDDSASRLQRFQDLVKDLAPPQLESRSLSRRNYPETVATVLLNKFEQAVRQSGKEMEFIPIFNIRYRDGVPMVTVGGIFVDQQDAEHWRKSREAIPFPWVLADGAGGQYEVDIPILTPKEKIALDRMMPCSERETLLANSPVKLQEHQLESYRQHYKYHPMFAELLL